MPEQTEFQRFVDSVPDLWSAYVRHPWMTAVHDGSLSREQFVFFLVQDMPYQRDFLNALVLAASRASSPDEWLELRAFIAAEAEFEAALLDDLNAEWTFDRWAAGPTRESYMNHLTRVAHEGSLGDIGAALLPCAAGFTGAMAEPASKDDLDPYYRRWLAFYERPEQARFSNQLVAIFEQAMAPAPVESREHARMIFVRSLQHQVAVFDAAWRVEDRW